MSGIHAFSVHVTTHFLQVQHTSEEYEVLFSHHGILCLLLV